MKTKHLLFFLSMATYFNVSAQEFAPYGAEWHYSNTRKGNIGYTNMKCVDSVVIEGKHCSVLEVDQNVYLSGEVIVYSTANGDSVYWYEQNSEQFQLIYAFDAQPGDSWSFAMYDMSANQLSNIDSVIAYVDSVDSININGIVLPRLTIKYNYVGGIAPRDSSKHKIIKYIGSTYSPFDFPLEFGIVDDISPYPNGLRCYEDSYLGFYETGIADSCTYEKKGTFTGELEEENEEVRLYPNPANNTLNISHQNGTLRSVMIYDLSGREVLAQPVSDAAAREHRLNLSSLPAGAYVVKVETGSKSVIKKLVVNK